MSSYDAFFQNKSRQLEQNYLGNIQELFYDLQRHFDLDYLSNKDDQFRNTNYSQKQQAQVSRLLGSINCLEVPKDALKQYIYYKKGSSNQTMELLPNFKTFIVRKIKGLLLTKVLNKEQAHNCINFIKSKPSFEALRLLLHPLQKCQQLRNHLLELFSSSQIIRQLMRSRIRLQQKQKLIKFIQRIRDKLQNPQSSRKWKQLFS